MNDLTIITRQEPGIASLDNFEEIRAYLDASLERYRNIVYTDENLKAAKDDKRTLSSLKRKLDDRRKEIKKIYMAPYQKIENQLKELMGMIDGPLEEIDAFVKQTELNEKQRQMLTIRGFYDEAAAPLGDLAGALFDSPAFFDPKWENKSTSVKAWQDAIRDKVAQAGQAIKTIQAAGGKHTAALISKYLETLDMDETLRYRKTLEAAALLSGARVDEVEDEDRVKGYKVLKVTGTRQQMTQLMEQLDLMGMEVEEIEDGMPGELKELTEPDFDSFVAFDIETSGSMGAANGDGPAEITEIGAVKVVDGKIVDRQDWLCDPGRSITPMVARLTHITDAMVAGKPPVSEVIRQFKEYIGDLPLVGHNIRSSDLHYIKRAADRAGVPMDNAFFDTYLFARKMKAARGWENVKLEYLSERFGIEQNSAHRAWCDAEANVGVYFRLREMA